MLKRVFVARLCPFFSIIYVLPLFFAYAVDRINVGVRRSSQEFGKGNLINLRIRRSLKGFGKGSLIKLESYRTDGRSLVKRKWTFFRRERPTIFAHISDPRLRADYIGKSLARVEKDGYNIINLRIYKNLQKSKREDLIKSEIYRNLGGFIGRATKIDFPLFIF
jgi:hypothetical protein